jgi:hypothetical protein
VVETAAAECDHCHYSPSTAATDAQLLNLSLHLSRRIPLVSIWRTNQSNSFVRLPDAPVGSDGSIQLTVAPGSIYTLTSTHGQRKGSTRTPPPSAKFPATHVDDFDRGPVEGLAKFWADQCGSFQVLPAPGGRRGLALTQRVTQPPGVNRSASPVGVSLQGTVAQSETHASSVQSFVAGWG